MSHFYQHKLDHQRAVNCFPVVKAPFSEKNIDVIAGIISCSKIMDAMIAFAPRPLHAMVVAIAKAPHYAGNDQLIAHYAEHIVIQISDDSGDAYHEVRDCLSYGEVSERAANCRIVEFAGDSIRLNKGFLFPVNKGFLHDMFHFVKAYLDYKGALPAIKANHQLSETLSFDHRKLVRIPLELGQLANLQSLDLSANHLKVFPSVVLNLTRLMRLNLKKNDLTRLPNSISDLTCLKRLCLEQNRLQSLPETLCLMTQLRVLLYDDMLVSEAVKEKVSQWQALKDQRPQERV